jgi:hypothetical protein
LKKKKKKKKKTKQKTRMDEAIKLLRVSPKQFS